MLSRSLFLTGAPPPPTISSFSPASLNNGGGNVTITGTNFISGATTVTIAGVAATTTVNSLTQLTVAFPSRARGTYAVVVSTPGGSATANFTHTWTPYISYITPSSVYYDYGSGYTIVGGNFSSSAASSVYVSNGGYYGISIANDGQLSFNPGALATGSYNAWVVAPDGWSNPVGFSTSWYPAPSISSVSDGRGGNGSQSGSSITISGSNFAYGTTTVTIGGVTISDPAKTGSSISFPCPNLGSDGTKTITITTTGSGGQSASTSVYFWGAKSNAVTTYTSGSGSYTPPQWANYLDVVCIGGGGAGGSAVVLAWGGGGAAGSYGSTVINLLSAGFGARSWSVGAGGTAPASPNWVAGAGGATTAAGVTGAGGAGGCTNCNGAAGASTTGFYLSGYLYNGVSGGGGGNSSVPSQSGGGGGGGNSALGPYAGIAGKSGQVWFVARQ